MNTIHISNRKKLDSTTITLLNSRLCNMNNAEAESININYNPDYNYSSTIDLTKDELDTIFGRGLKKANIQRKNLFIYKGELNVITGCNVYGDYNDSVISNSFIYADLLKTDVYESYLFNGKYENCNIYISELKKNSEFKNCFLNSLKMEAPAKYERCTFIHSTIKIDYTYDKSCFTDCVFIDCKFDSEEEMDTILNGRNLVLSYNGNKSTFKYGYITDNLNKDIERSIRNRCLYFNTDGIKVDDEDLDIDSVFIDNEYKDYNGKLHKQNK